MPNFTIRDICTKDKLIRSNYYSDTYRIEVTRNKVRMIRDAQHISIPFSPEKEIILRERFGYTDEELDRFYEQFGKNLQHYAAISKELLEKSRVSIDSATVYIDAKTVIPKSGGVGSEVYFLMNPIESLIGEKSLISQKATTLHNILTLGIRLLRMLQTYNNNGICVGTIDLDSFYMTAGEEGKMQIRDGYFFFAKAADGPVSLTKDAMTFLPPDIQNGKAGISPDSDMYVLCALLWTLLDGRHYTEAPDLTRPPKYAPASLTAALRNGMEHGISARETLSNELREAKRTCRDGIIYLTKPEYQDRITAKVEEYRKHHVELEEEEEEEPETQYDPEEELAEDNTIFLDHMTGKQKLAAGTAAAILSAAVIAGCLITGKILGENGWGVTAKPAVPFQQEKIPEETEAPIAPPLDVVYTPAPVPTSNPITPADYPTLELDADYEWFRSEYPATDFCAIDFENSFEISEEIIERWNFYLDNDSITCYVYKRPAFRTDISCSSEGGNKVLVISGNGSGKMCVAMRQNELAEYLQYKFTYGTLNGLSVLSSTGSTPFSIPVLTPATEVPDEEEHEPDSTDAVSSQVLTAAEKEERDREAAEELLRQEQEQQAQRQSAWQAGDIQTSPVSSSNNTVSSQQTVQTPDWSNSSTWVIDGGDWGNEPQTTVITDNGIETQLTTYSLVLYATNSVIGVGETTEIYNAGNTGPFTSVMSSNMQSIGVSQTPDANGHYRVTGLSPGVADISVTDQYGYSSRITIQCVPNN